MIRPTAAWTTPWRVKGSNGDIREVLRAIFHGPDFWATQNVRAKVKTPLEFVVSAARAVSAERILRHASRRWWRASASRCTSMSLPTGTQSGKPRG